MMGSDTVVDCCQITFTIIVTAIIVGIQMLDPPDFVSLKVSAGKHKDCCCPYLLYSEASFLVFERI